MSKRATVDPLGILTGPYTLSSLVPPDLSKCTNQGVLEYFENTYSLNESIFTAIKSAEVFYKCPDRLRLPLIFYYGHTASVYINKLILAGIITERVDFGMETMFETGVDEMNWDDTENYRMGGSYQWPKLPQVTEFRRKVREVIRKAIKSARFDLPVTMDDPLWALFMGFEHERIHLETSSVLIRQLPIEMVRVPALWNRAPLESESGETENEMIRVNATSVLLGKPVKFPSYGWDNEYPQMQMDVPDFQASKFLISNSEFYQFVFEGGYREKHLWTSEGWQWRTYRKAVHPTFWVCTQGCPSGSGEQLSNTTHCGRELHRTNGTNGKPVFRHRTLCEVIDMPWSWPVVVNCHEARAFCRWKGEDYRLITEAEHNAIRDLSPINGKFDVRCDPVYDKEVKQRYNLNLAYCTSTPVDHYPPNEAGFHDVFGNVWQWTEDHFNGFPGMATHEFYDDFSSPCFDGRHNVILGGSWVSTGDEASRFARYSFRRHFFQHAGFRLARTIDNNTVPARLVQLPHYPKKDIPFKVADPSTLMVESTNTQFMYEEPRMVHAQLIAEYSNRPGGLYEQLSGFIQTFVKERNIAPARAFSLNTGCGRMTFELCRHFKKVVGTDFSEAFFEACTHMQRQGSKRVQSSARDQRTLVSNGHEDTEHTDGHKDMEQSNGHKDTERTNGHKDMVDQTVELPMGIDPSRAIFKQFTWVPNELSDFDFVLLQDLHRAFNKKAWLLRLWEVIKPSGVVIIASNEGLGGTELGPLVGTRIKCIQTHELSFKVDESKEATLTLTVWARDV